MQRSLRLWLSEAITILLKISRTDYLFAHMSNLQEIEQAVSQLSSSELITFRNWFAEFDAEIWDRQFEEDVATGKLNALAEQARKHLREGRCTDL
jgi:hypothetical protein